MTPDSSKSSIPWGSVFQNGEWVKVCYACGRARHVARDFPNRLKKGKGESGVKEKGEYKGGVQKGEPMITGKG